MNTNYIAPLIFKDFKPKDKKMTDKTNEIKFALEFPQGLILFVDSAAYFQPHKSTDAFSVSGERKELFGKNAINVAQNKDTGADAYSVVYEFAANGALADARLVAKTETVNGKLADEKTVLGLNEALAQNKITLHKYKAPDSIFNAAQFLDGRLLIQLFNENQLYLGTPGNYTKLDAELKVQGGNSMYYKTATGESIDLPYGYGGPGPGNVPKFDGEELSYLDVGAGSDPAKLGLDLSPGIAHLNPFSPQLTAPKPQRPKPPRSPGL